MVGSLVGLLESTQIYTDADTDSGRFISSSLQESEAGRVRRRDHVGGRGCTTLNSAVLGALVAAALAFLARGSELRLQIRSLRDNVCHGFV